MGLASPSPKKQVDDTRGERLLDLQAFSACCAFSFLCSKLVALLQRRFQAFFPLEVQRLANWPSVSTCCGRFQHEAKHLGRQRPNRASKADATPSPSVKRRQSTTYCRDQSSVTSSSKRSSASILHKCVLLEQTALAQGSTTSMSA